MQSETTPEDIEVKAPASDRERPRFHTLKRFWRSDKLMSLFALLISMGTFITFAYQNYLIQKQQYRSVMPYLMMYKSTGFQADGQRKISLVLANNGVGPAFVESLKISYDGQEYSTVYDFFLNGLYVKTPIISSRTGLPEGYAIPANETIYILASEDSSTAEILDKVFTQVQVEITYSSLYDEQWKMHYGDQISSKPIPID